MVFITLWAAGSSPALAQGGGGIDLALVINGSGSISPTDFALQKDGIKAALLDPLILPRDGSVALTLIQYADATTQIHVPYTVISSANVTSVIAQVDALGQIGGATNPGDGINTANDVFNADGNAANDQVICLSTDGLPNAGADVGTAVENSKASQISLDKFTVIAIEDPPFFFADDFESFYGPFVFGKPLPSAVGVGTVTVVQDAVEFANTVGGCLTKAVQLISVEVNQAIQDLHNSIELVTDKTTYVRAHIRTPSLTPTRVFARLHGTRNGTPLPGSPLTPENENGSIEVRTGSAQERGELDSSFYFRLPSSAVDSDSWLNGSVELEVEVVGTELECLEVADTPNDCKVQAMFSPTDQLEVEFVRVEWTEDGIIHRTLPAHTSELAERLRAIYPIASDASGLDRVDGQLNYVGPIPPDLFRLNVQLELMRLADLCLSLFGCERLYYGVLRGANLGGLANGIPGLLPGVVSSGTMPADDLVYGRNTHAHELGHNLDRHHAVFDLQLLPPPPRKIGGCEEEASPLAPDFPNTTVINGVTVATIGPVNLTEDDLIFGFDTHLVQDLNNREQAVIDPLEHFELMSYCGNLPLPFAQSVFRWISDFTYNGIRTEINNRFSSSSASASLTGPALDHLVVRGTVDFLNDTAEFVPFSLISSPIPLPPPPPGDFTLQLLEAGNNVLVEVPFQPTEYRADFPAEEPNAGTFLIPVLADSDFKQAVVLHNGNTLASISASPNAPTVQVIFPNGGEGVSGIQTTLQWTGSDPDGDSLTYLVQFSADGGNTWKTLIADWPSQSYDVELSFLKETTNGLIRVVASDGFNTARDDSDGPFSTPNNPPQVSIVSPANNAVFVGTQSISFDGEAIDQEDGQLTNTSLEWRSDKDGILGIGENFTIKAADLSVGEHIITLTATDGGGVTATAAIKITVVRIAPPPNQPPIADAGDDQTLECAVTQGANVTLNGTSSTDPDDDGLTFSWTAPGIVFDNPASPTPVATFPLGTTTVTLVVSDGLLGSVPDTVDIAVQDTTPPVVSAEWMPLEVKKDEGEFILEFGATDICDPAPEFTGVLETPDLDGLEIKLKTKSKVKIEFDFEDGKVEIQGPDPEALLTQLQELGGLLVDSGQLVKVELEEDDEGEFEFKFENDGTLRIEAPSATLKGTSVDASGNTATVQVSPQFEPEEDDKEEDDDDGDQENEDDKDNDGNEDKDDDD